MKIKPLFDRIVIKQNEAETKTASGIILAGNQEKPQTGTVLSVGEGGIIDGKEIVMKIKPNDTVIYPKYAGSEFKLNGETFIVLRQSDVLAILEED